MEAATKQKYENILQAYGFKNPGAIYPQLTPEELIEHAIKKNQGILADSGAICINTGKFTGRSPKDRFIVRDAITDDSVDWNEINQPISVETFDKLRQQLLDYLDGKDVYVRDAFACADEHYRFPLRVFTELPWSNQFVNNMFLRPSPEELDQFEPSWTVLCAPGFKADPNTEGLRQENFAIVNFTDREIIIGGTGYTGEIKKGIFSVLNFVLPHDHKVLSMHCSANVGPNNDTAIFFGLSGTGKTTLSADPERRLIGDDEHGWSENGVFNFEGGCYAKTIDLSAEKEPEIYAAIKHGAILENIGFFPGTRTPDYEDDSITPNTRVSYPLYHIDNALPKSMGDHPTSIFFLTCDAFGVLPPISRLTKGQAMYHFISGYTAKVAGTEEGVDEPQETFSACFGAPFLPLHPTQYADMLGERMEQHKVNVWLVNTGWTGGDFNGGGHRISLKYTRAMITAALHNDLDRVDYETHPVFGLQIPATCPNVPDEILNPKNTWKDAKAYDAKAAFLAKAFQENFRKFEDRASKEIIDAGPKVL